MKIKLGLIALALSASSFSLNLNAAVTPTGVSDDGKIRVVEYNKNQVVNINSKFGVVTLIQLEDDEIIDNDANGGLGLGDKKAWSIDVRGNHIFLKPTSKSPNTNMVVVTNKRTYAFNLRAVANQTAGYIVRFNYPDTQAALESEATRRSAAIQAKLNGVKNTSVRALNMAGYFMRGDKALAPTKMWDDGRFTYLKYANSADLPAIYRILPDGKESLVNTHVEKDTIVIQETAKGYMLRLGQSALEIHNAKFDPKGTFNELGTSSDEMIRLERGVAE